MKVHSKASLFVVMVGVLGALSIAAVAADPATAQIKAEIARLQQSIKDKPVTDKDFGPIATMAEGALGVLTAALDAGQGTAIEKLGQAQDLLQGHAQAPTGPRSRRSGSPHFSRTGKVSLRPPHSTRTRTSGMEQLRWPCARCRSGTGQGYPLTRGRRGIRCSHRPQGWFVYVGEAEGEADFATFGEPLTPPDNNPPGRRYDRCYPSCRACKPRRTPPFQPPQSIDLHSRFIALNSQIKLAQELDASRFYAGALYAYMEAVRHYGMLRPPPLDASNRRR